MILALLLAQAAAAPPDIELRANVRARSLTIEKRGDARLTLTTEPDGGNLIDVRAPRAEGRKTIRNLDVTVRAEARIGAPGEARAAAETQPPQ